LPCCARPSCGDSPADALLARRQDDRPQHAANKRELAAWLERFTALGLQIHADEVVLQGFPWKQTICVRGQIDKDDPAEGRVYDNRYVIRGQIRWGKMREYEVYEDTEASARLDEWLERTGTERPSP
jgi:hypothetical protein